MMIYVFTIHHNGFDFSHSVEFKNTSPIFRNITFKKSNYKLEFHVSKTSNNHERNISEAKIEVNKLADKLSLLPNHRISLVACVGYFDNENQYHSIGSRHKSGGHAKAQIVIKDPEQYYKSYENKKILTSRYNLGAVRLFRLSMGTVDKFSEYLILYGILQIVIADEEKKNEVSQKVIDKKIMEMEPTVLMVEDGKFMETIYTRTRNLISHPKNGTDLDKAFENVNNYIQPLREMVREIIIQSGKQK